MKTKDGEKITLKEYLKRWKKGIQEITPIQKLINESRGTLITLIGFIAAVVVMVIYREKFIVNWFAYALILIFVGNIWTTGIKWITLRQQLKYFKKTESLSVNIDKILDTIDMKGGEE